MHIHIYTPTDMFVYAHACMYSHMYVNFKWLRQELLVFGMAAHLMLPHFAEMAV